MLHSLISSQGTCKGQACLDQSACCSLIASGCCTGAHGPAHLQKRIDAFLEGLAPRFDKIGAEEFETDRRALIAAKLQKDHALSDEADRNWEQISNRRCRLLMPLPI